MEPTILASPRPVVIGGSVVVLGTDRKLEIDGRPRVVGRDPSCDLPLDDPKISSTHLELVATEHGLRVRDLGSTNGVFLGAHQIADAVLTAAAELRCGDTVLRFEPRSAERVELSSHDELGPMVGATPHMRALFARLRKVAASDLSLLVTGETGTGKELVAQAVHDASKRARKPFVVVDCSAIPATLAESVLFGHEAGSFTGASSRRVSPFVEAHGGTLFLDELGELPMDIQPKLLRALAERKVKALGATQYTSVDVRVVAATWRDLPREVNRGRFRADLLFRVAEERVDLPALRQRLDDIPVLVERMMADAGKREAFGRVVPTSLDRLAEHGWPGNVRELRSLVRRALSYDEGGAIDLAAYLSRDGHGVVQVPARAATAQPGAKLDPALPYEDSKEAHDRAYFQALFDKTSGNVSEMARQADVTRTTIRAQLRRHGIERDGVAG